MLAKVSKDKPFWKFNSLKDNEYSLNGFSITENSFRIFESTNHRRGRENSKLKIGPTLDQSFAKLGPNFEVNSAKISSIWLKDYFLSESWKSEGVWQGLRNMALTPATPHVVPIPFGSRPLQRTLQWFLCMY